MQLLLVLFLIPLAFSIDDIDGVQVSPISSAEFDRYFDQVLSRASSSELDAVEALQKAVTKCAKDKDQISCIVPEYASIVIEYGLDADFKKTIVEAIKRKQVFKSDGSPRVNNIEI